MSTWSRKRGDRVTIDTVTSFLVQRFEHLVVECLLRDELLEPRVFVPAATANLPYSWRRICDAVDNTCKPARGWRVSVTGFTSVRFHSLPASLKLEGREVVSDPIGLVKVDLVGRLSIESVMGHYRVVLPNVEIDQLLELKARFSRASSRCDLRLDRAVASRASSRRSIGVGDLGLKRGNVNDRAAHEVLKRHSQLYPRFPRLTSRSDMLSGDMLIDAQEIPAGSELNATVAIIGAGPAGIAIAQTLAASRVECLLLEAGGLEAEHAKETGLQPAPTATYDLGRARYRGFGGSSQQWLSGGWRARPMDPIDFRERRAVPDGAWPLMYTELVPYLERAQTLCGLPNYNYDYSHWIAKEPSQGRLRIEGPDLRNVMFRISPPRRFASMAEELDYTPCLRVSLRARVAEIGTGENGAVTHLNVKRRDRGTFQVRAHAYVLAAGGIDNPRLMLASAIGSDHDLVGRYFQEHLHVSSGVFRPDTLGDSSQQLGFYPPHYSSDGTKIQAALGLTEDCMEREGLQNATLWLYPIHATAATDGLKSVNAIRAAVRDRRFPEHMPDHTIRIVKDWAALYQSFNRKLKRGYVAPTLAQVAVEAEQRPNPDSRVVLTSERDEFGVLIPRLEWRITEADKESIRRTQDLVDAKLQSAGLGCIENKLGEEMPPAHIGGGSHHMGTTRMHTDPKRGVVDTDSRVHGCPNLFVAGSSVFPSSGSANPTLTLIALALRLADHLSGQLRP